MTYVDQLRNLRRATATAFAGSLRPLLDTVPTEVAIRDAAHNELSRIPEVSEEGWYQPPPKGIIVAVGNERVSRDSFRPKDTWPSTTVTYDTADILYVYGARVHRQTGLISDLACSLYRGSDDAMHELLQDVWQTTLRIAQTAEMGMSLAELHAEAMRIIEKSGMTNHVASPSDPAGTNIGHTIPWTDAPPTPEQARVLQTGEPREIAQLVNQQRRFVSAVETLEISANTAFSVEPRLERPGFPRINFHVVVAFDSTQKVIVTEFEPLFELFSMQGFSM